MQLFLSTSYHAVPSCIVTNILRVYMRNEKKIDNIARDYFAVTSLSLITKMYE